MSAPILEVTFNASGAADAGARARVVVVIDVVDSSTSAEAALDAGALEVLGAAPAKVEVPVPVRPRAVGVRAAETCRRLGTEAVVAAEPRTGSEAERFARVRPVLDALDAGGVKYEVVPNQGAELPNLVDLDGKVVVVVSATGGTAFDAALTAGAPGVGFATTARVAGMPGWRVAGLGARRAVDLVTEHATGLSVVAASANSTDDCLGAFEIARAIIAEGFLQL